MKIGSLELENPFILAPMAGITDSAFRLLCRRQGASLVYTEMVSAKGLQYGSERTKDLLAMSDEERPVAVQLFGSEPEIIAGAVRAVLEGGPASVGAVRAVPKGDPASVGDVEAMPRGDSASVGDDQASASKAAVIDINMGCPMLKIVKNGEGSALMKDIDLAGRIVEAAVAAAGSTPITVKMRSGWDSDSLCAAELASVVASAGAAAVAVHGRCRNQFYSGRSDRSVIAAVKKAVGDVAVIGSGDVWTAADALALMDETGCDGVMFARGALGNPWIFKEALMLADGASKDDIAASHPSRCERAEMFCEHARLVAQGKGERIATMQMRKHAGWYFKGMHGVAELKRQINRSATLDDLLDVVASFTKTQ